MDSPTEETQLWLAELEHKLASQQAKNDQVLDALNTTLWLLTRMTQNNSLPQLNPLFPASSATKTKIDLKPAALPNFDGDRLKGKGFVNACQAYFRIRPDQFLDEQTKIQWAMTYMNQGSVRGHSCPPSYSACLFRPTSAEPQVFLIE